MPRYLADDSQTWDMPDSARTPEERNAIAPSPNRFARRQARRQASRARREAPPVSFKTQVKGFVDTVDSSLEGRVKGMAEHALGLYAPAEVGLSLAHSSDPDPMRSFTYLAREGGSLPVEWYFQKYTGPNGREAYIHDGTVYSAWRANKLVEKISTDPKSLKAILGGIVDQYNETIQPSAPHQRRYRAPAPLKVTDVANVMGMLYHTLGQKGLTQMTWEQVAGTAIQLAASLKTPASRDLFAKNLTVAMGQEGARWDWMVMQAEAAARVGTEFTDQAQVVAFGNPGVAQDFRMQALGAFGVRHYTDASGEHYVAWDPVRSEWYDVEAKPVPGHTATGQPRVLVGSTEARVTDVASRPTQEILPADIANYWGGTMGTGPSFRAFTVQALGLTPGIHHYDLSRPEDFYKQAMEIQHAAEIDKIAAENTPFIEGGKQVLDFLNLGFKYTEAGFLRLTAGVAHPINSLIYGSDRADQALNIELQVSDDIKAGDDTVGGFYARSLGLPALAAIPIDLAIASAFDPLMAGTKYLREARNVLTLSSMLEWQRDSEFLAKAFGTKGEAVAKWLLENGDRIDEAIGRPLFGQYASGYDRWKWLVDRFVDNPERHWGNQTFIEALLSDARQGGDLYTRLNARLRPLLSRDAFDAQFVENVKNIVKFMDQAGGISEAEKLANLRGFVLSHFGIPDAFDAKVFRDFVQWERQPGTVYTSSVKSPGVSFVGKGEVRPGFRDPGLVFETDIELGTQLPNTVGDVKYASAQDVLVGGKPVVGPVPVQRPVSVYYDWGEFNNAFDALQATSLGTFGRSGLEMPRYSRWGAVNARFTQTAVGQSRFARALGGLGARTADAVVNFEAGDFAENVARRLARGNVPWTPEEIDRWSAEARTISLATNPNRESDMIAFLEKFERVTFDKIADDVGLGTNREIIWEQMHKQAQEVRDRIAREAFGVKSYKIGPDGVTFEYEAEQRPLLTSQLINSWYIDDPVAQRAMVREAIGLGESHLKWMQNMLRDIPGFRDLELGKDLSKLTAEDLKPAVLARFSKTLGKSAYGWYLKLWKPLVVLRPGYILRVPAFDEQIRFLADRGLAERIRSTKAFGNLVGRAADAGVVPEKWAVDTQVIGTVDGGSVEFSRLTPGALADDAYANSRGVGEFAQTWQEQLINAGKAVKRKFWDLVAPEDTRYEDAWNRAVNGHYAHSSAGQVALRSIAAGESPEETAQRLVAWAATPLGKAEAERLGIINVEAWAEGVAKNAHALTISQPNVAAAALRSEASTSMLDDTLKQYTDLAEAWSAAREGKANYSLAALRPENAIGRGRNPYMQQILNEIEENGGGATWDPTTGEFIRKGGVGVGIRPGSVVTRRAGTWETPSKLEQAIRDLVGKEGGTLRTFEGAKIGFWADGEGTLHIDVSVVAPADVAKGLGVINQQEALWDMDRSLELAVPAKAPVHGQNIEHITGAGPSVVRPFVDQVGKYIVEMPTNVLSRQPFFKSWYDEVLRAQQDILLQSGWKPATEEAANIALKAMEDNARAFALERLDRVMFNFKETTRLAEMMGFIAPFMQPWQEAFIVYGHLLQRNPSLVLWVNRIFNSAIQNGVFYRDDNGQLAMNMTHFGPFAASMMLWQKWGGINFSAPLASYNLFFNSAATFAIPGVGNVPLPVPGLAPPAQLLMQQIFENNGSRLSTWLFQYGPMTPQSLIMPTWMTNLTTAFFPVLNQAQYDAKVDDFLELAQAHHMKFPGATIADQNQARLDWAKAQAKALFFYKAFMSAFLPATPSINFDTQPLEQEWHQLLENNGGDYATARDEFLKRHPDQWLIPTARSLWDKVDPNLPASLQTRAIPATEIAQKILSTEWGRKFANDYPAMVFALLTKDAWGDFSLDEMMAQFADGSRTMLSPETFYNNAEAAHGWDTYWHLKESWLATQEGLTQRNLKDGDPEWEVEQHKFDQAVTELRNANPGFNNEFGNFEDANINPQVLAYAQRLAKNKVFSGFPAGKGLAEYMDLRNKIAEQMALQNVSSLDTVAATRTGLADQYNQGVASIVAKYPEFEPLFQMFFDGKDLMKVDSAALTRVNQVLKDNPAVATWQTDYNDIQDQLDAALDDVSRGPIYQQEAELINRAYTDYPPNQNPAVVWYSLLSNSDKREYQERVWQKPFMYLNRFEKDEVLGVPTDDYSEGVWLEIAKARTYISQQGKLDPNFDTGAAYDKLNVYIQQQAAASPTFAAQVAIENVWGKSFFDHATVPDGSTLLTNQTDSKAGEAWSALRDAAVATQAAIEKAGLHGTSTTEAQYNQARQSFLEYIRELQKWSPTFAAQWNELESASSGDLAAAMFPTIWYRLGESS